MMSQYRGTTKGLKKALGAEGASLGTDEWRRWDEELVEDFGRWVGIIAIILGSLILLVLAAIIIV